MTFQAQIYLSVLECNQDIQKSIYVVKNDKVEGKKREPLHLFAFCDEHYRHVFFEFNFLEAC